MQALAPWADLVNMYVRVEPSFLKDSIWVVHPEVLAQLLNMEDTGGSPIWRGNGAAAATAAPNTLMGRPLFVSTKSSGLGEAGDCVILDPSMIAYGEVGGIRIESSVAPGWYQDKVSFRAIMRADSQALLGSTITPRYGTNELSAYVMLDT